MKLRKLISVLTVLSLLISSAGLSVFAQAGSEDKGKPPEKKDAIITESTEELTQPVSQDFNENTEETVDPTESDSEQDREESDDLEPDSDKDYEALKIDLEAELKRAQTFNKEDYTEETYSRLKIEMFNCMLILENWDNLYTGVDLALENLRNAIDGLRTYGDILLSAVENGEKIAPDWYTEESYKMLSDALNKGRETAEKGNVSKETAVSIISEIDNAKAGLVNIKDLLKQKIEEAKKRFELLYEENSLAEFKSEIERIEKALTGSLTPEDVKKLTDDVLKSYEILKPAMGDINFSGDITIEDATALQKYIGFLESEIETSVADVNFDGIITISDVTNIQKYIGGLIDKFEKEPHVPDYDKEWNLVLVNYKYPIKSGYVPDMRVVGGRSIFTFDKRAADALEKMLEDCRAEGLDPLICSAYRTQELQEQLFANKVAYYTNQGYSYDKAVELAKTSVAYPGTSEHQLGLAVDIVSLHYQILDEGQLKTAEQQWLMKNCWKYGFILRYPTGKQDITGVIFEPWHYRYVGVEAAKEITERGITLEEYLELE